LPPAPADTQRLSNQTPGTLALGVTPGLLELLPTSTCMRVNGGFVQIPFSPALNPPQAFSLEAWVVPFDGGGSAGPVYYQCLVENTGPTGLGPRTGGWGLYIGPYLPADPPVDPPGSPYYWQVWMYDNTNVYHQIALSNTPVVANKLSYVVLTFNQGQNSGPLNVQLFVYIPDTNQDLTLNAVRALGGTVNGFQANTSGDFFIGAGSNLFPNAGPPAQPLYPFNGEIQEVALYNVDLSGGPPNYEGVSTILGVHEAAGGNF
jgi:Concanavalin A-like lectin/glucanases superfamily